MRAVVVKAIPAGNLRGEFRAVTEDDVATVLGSLTNPYGSRASVLTAKEIKDLLMTGPTTTYTYIGTGRIPAHHFLTVALKAFEMGDPALVELCIPSGYQLVPYHGHGLNGSVEDEECRIVGNVDRAREALARGNRKLTTSCLQEAKQALADFEAEAEAHWKGRTR